MLLRDEAAHARGMLKRAMLVFAFLVPLSVAYHFWKVSEVLAEQVELLRDIRTAESQIRKRQGRSHAKARKEILARMRR